MQEFQSHPAIHNFSPSGVNIGPARMTLCQRST
jgi:hypothetical protein